MDIQMITQYPRSVATIKDLPQFLSDNPKVYTYFQYQTKTDHTELMNLLNVKIPLPKLIPTINLADTYGRYSYGQTDAKNHKILIRENILIGLEMAKLETTVYNTSFILALTILHELVHYLRGIKHIKDADREEPGRDFERWSFGSVAYLDNVYAINKYQRSFHHLKWLIQRDRNVIHDYSTQ